MKIIPKPPDIVYERRHVTMPEGVPRAMAAG